MLLYDAFILTETWLSSDISNAELGFEGYTVFRRDRNNSTSNCLRGGGVLIAVKNNLLPVTIEFSSNCIEQVFLVECPYY